MISAIDQNGSFSRMTATGTCIQMHRVVQQVHTFHHNGKTFRHNRRKN